MRCYVAQMTVILLIQAGKHRPRSMRACLRHQKENAPDVRTTRVPDLMRELEGYGCHVFVYAPSIPDAGNVFKDDAYAGCDVVALAVPDQEFLRLISQSLGGRARGRGESACRPP